jgi:hypothetical protein
MEIMHVSIIDFINSPDIYLNKVDLEAVHITKEGRTIAVLAKPSDTPITDSLLGLLKGTVINGSDDIKKMRTGI